MAEFKGLTLLMTTLSSNISQIQSIRLAYKIDQSGSGGSRNFVWGA